VSSRLGFSSLVADSLLADSDLPVPDKPPEGESKKEELVKKMVHEFKGVAPGEANQLLNIAEQELCSSKKSSLESVAKGGARPAKTVASIPL
jgi:hypothetical protein